MSHPNEDLIRKGYAAFSAGDMDTLRTLFTPDAIWHVPGRNPLSGSHKGIEEILGYFGKSMELTDGTLAVDLHDVAANDEHVFAAHTTTAARNSKSLRVNSVLVFHASGGKVTEVWQVSGDQYAEDDFWA